MFNESRELVDNIAAATGESIVITWTSNEPTAAVIQTIADGDGAAPTLVAQVITWTLNAPAASAAQTIANGAGAAPTLVAQVMTYTANAPAASAAQTIADGAGAAPTAEAIVVTWSSNTPTPAVTQTISNGSSVTDGETGQWIANMEAQLGKIVADAVTYRAERVELFQYTANVVARRRRPDK